MSWVYSEVDRLVDTRDVQGLIDVLDTPSARGSRPERGRIIHKLGKLGDQRAVTPICDSLLNDPDGHVRIKAAMALGRLGDPEALPGLWKTIDQPRPDDPNGATRLWAIRSLGQIRDRASVERLIALLDDSDWGVRSHAAGALGEIGDQRATLPLLPLLRDARKTVRMSTGRALVALGDSRALEPMREAHAAAPLWRSSGLKGSLRHLEARFG